jgi:hypothetical protein
MASAGEYAQRRASIATAISLAIEAALEHDDQQKIETILKGVQ